MSPLGANRERRGSVQFSALFPWLSGTYRAIMASSLARNAFALMSSIVATSILGLLFWLLAGRLFDQAAVGIGSVLINTALTISVITRISLNTILQRFLPGSGPGASRFVLGSLAVGGTLGCLAGLAFALVAGPLVPDLAFLSQSWSLSLLFSVIVAVWSLYSLIESTLGALRAAHWVPVLSIGSSVIKIGVLVSVSLFAANGLGLLAAWIIPVLPAIALGIFLVFGILLPRLSQRGKPLASLGTMVRFGGVDYLAGLAPTIAIAAAPLIVLTHAGPEAAAHYYVGWLIAYSLYLMGHAMGISLLAESVVAGERIASLAGQAIVQAVFPIIGVSIAIALLAPVLMSLFGPAYQADGALILQFLALSCIPWALETIFLAVARAKDWLPALLGVQWLNLVLVLSLGLFLVPRMGGSGMALAWLLAQSSSVLVILIGTVMTFGTGRTLNTAVILTSGFGRIARAVVRFREKPAQVMPLQVDPALAAPAHEAEGVALLHADHRLGQMAHLLPGIASPEPREYTSLRENKAEGSIGGLHLLEQNGDWPSYFAKAVDAMAQIHSLTSSSRQISPSWADAWITKPLASIRQVHRKHGAAAPNETLIVLENHMLAFWMHRRNYLGVTHCNLEPASFLFNDMRLPAIRIIEGWSHMRGDGPAGFDICHLALTTRMVVRDQELGPIVHDLLNGGTWSAEEREWLYRDGPAGEWLEQDDVMREMVMLTWINHLARNIQEDPAYVTNTVWRAINIDWAMRQASRYVLAR